MWGNKAKVFRSWRIERNLGPELEKQFSKQIGSCGIRNLHFSRQEISTDQSAFIFWSTVQIHLAASHCCSFFLASTLCAAVQPIPFFLLVVLLFFKAGAAGYLQNDVFLDSLSKLKILCYIAISPVATGLHFLLTCALSHDRWLRDASRSVRGISWKTTFKELV